MKRKLSTALTLCLFAAAALFGPDAAFCSEGDDLDLARFAERFALDYRAGAVPQETEVPVPAGEEEDEIDITMRDATGTDPRGIGNRFTPYYWYGKMDDDLEVRWLSLSGMIAIDERTPLTIDWPLAKETKFRSVKGFKNGKGAVPFVPGGNPIVGGGDFPYNTLDADGDTVGMGDLVLRIA